MRHTGYNINILVCEQLACPSFLQNTMIASHLTMKCDYPGESIVIFLKPGL